jgi:uncharacterized membrane protein
MLPIDLLSDESFILKIILDEFVVFGRRPDAYCSLILLITWSILLDCGPSFVYDAVFMIGALLIAYGDEICGSLTRAASFMLK